MEDSANTATTTVTLNYRIDSWRNAGQSSPFDFFSVPGIDQEDCDRQARERFDRANNEPATQRLGLELVQVVKPAVDEVIRRIVTNGRETGEQF